MAINGTTNVRYVRKKENDKTRTHPKLSLKRNRLYPGCNFTVYIFLGNTFSEMVGGGDERNKKGM